jgi:hypothetical protein
MGNKKSGKILFFKQEISLCYLEFSLQKVYSEKDTLNLKAFFSKSA